jgi:outer membrane protein assembly factor BamC
MPLNPVMAPILSRATPARLAVLALAVGLSGCSSLGSMISGDKVDYRTQAAKSQPLDVPPDLTQLAKEGRYQPQAGVVVSASTMKPAGSSTTAVAPSAAPAAAGVAPDAVGDLRVVRDGQQRWLVSNQSPEKLFPLVRAFWLERGFTLKQDSPELGLLETDFAENRANLPDDIVRRTLGRVLDSLYSTGLRDSYRTRIERTATGSEIYITHRGVEEVYTKDKDSTRWQPRAVDPQLEAEFLSRLMVRLGNKDDAGARAAVAAAPAAAAASGSAGARPRVAATGNASALELNEGFDRAWRQVGLALDRSGFTVEDRDRSAGLYFVRYADPKLATQDEPNFFAKLFSRDSDAAKRLQRYRVVVKATGEKSTVTVQTSDGQADSGDAGRAIIGRLTESLR